MNFRQFKKKHKLTRQPYGFNHKGDVAIPISWATARKWYNKGYRINLGYK